MCAQVAKKTAAEWTTQRALIAAITDIKQAFDSVSPHVLGYDLGCQRLDIFRSPAAYCREESNRRGACA